VLERFYEQNNLMLPPPFDLAGRGYFSSSFGIRNDPFTGSRDALRSRHIDGNGARGRDRRRIVLYASRRGTYGNIVVIDHKFGVMTRYAHLRLQHPGGAAGEARRRRRVRGNDREEPRPAPAL
jgi:murein DD-endopeptidase MepM/ murein hydrolase activator NlpD